MPYWPIWIFLSIGALLIGALILIVWMIMQYFTLPERNRIEDAIIVGQKGTIKAECTPHHRGKVYVMGAYWDAISEYGALKEDEDIEVISVRNNILFVRKVDLYSGKPQGGVAG